MFGEAQLEHLIVPGLRDLRVVQVHRHLAGMAYVGMAYMVMACIGMTNRAADIVMASVIFVSFRYTDT